MHDIKILGIQTGLIWEDVKGNIDAITKKIELAFDGHDLIILPETFTTGFSVDPKKFAENINGITVNWMRDLSQKLNAVITGSLLLSHGTNYTNTLIWMRPDGTMDSYEKRHLFSMGGEDKKISPGKKPLFVELKGWKIKPMICYDLRFPVWSKNTYNDGFEYDLAIYIANWPAVRSYAWRTLLLARAIENQSYVIGLNRVGTDGLNIQCNGDSMIIDPMGEIIKETNDGKEEALSVNLSHDALKKFRSKFNVGPDWDKFEII
ncbi:MAG: amidohydrolase [Lentimicrobiaceae bacterium]|jgi:predicted amidohydrolase|nr:amidohydrolase [Lentimicrobiaceae bacterium]MBT3455219.1 amidohydrolase [Lentimicrobiaceae bacterium]MBT3818621.1 amidohydrolase [Lentimicrobiaceae bacterium]MBT4061394.1 amidohydrolase [Lentimicrobiaceae bacterium]MBT4191303.1 amidohydrolase [Lentimicrobiaceae bacterium]